MSNDNNSGNVTRNSFASRLLNKAINERKKTGEKTITTAEAAKYAQEETELSEKVTTANVR